MERARKGKCANVLSRSTMRVANAKDKRPPATNRLSRSTPTAGNFEGTDEASLLASLGSTVECTSKYEQNVIREASLQAAPALTGTGIPELASLVPSYQGSNRPIGRSSGRKNPGVCADLPHVRKVLSRTRASLTELQNRNPGGIESKEANILRMKMQILLSFLETMGEGKKVDSRAEIAAEKKRSNTLINGTQKITSSERSSSTSTTGNVKMKVVDKSQNSPTLTAAERLERAKNGLMWLDDGVDAAPKITSSSATASFGMQALIEREDSIAMKSQQRRSVMGMKRKVLEDGNAEGATNENEECRKAMVEMRKKRRDACRKRREQRQKIWDEREGELSCGEAESEIQDSEDGVKMIVDVKTPEVVSSFEEGGDNRSSGSPRRNSEIPDSNSKKVICPICERSFHMKDGAGESADASLSAHIDRCRRRGNNSAPLKEMASVEGDITPQSSETDTDSDDDYKPGPKKLGNKSSSKRKLKDKITCRTRNRSVNTSTTEASNSTSLRDCRKRSCDDIDLLDYEDRIDEWIISGLTNMKSMNDQDSTNSDPGAAQYPGGLNIPAWINNRLFSYQRTALRWMWELHNQGAGGIIGDEMGLGKTVQVSSFLGVMAASRKLKSVLIISPATMLKHWLKELSVWSPGLRRILIHKSGETDGFSRVISKRLLAVSESWLQKARTKRVNERTFGEDDEDDEDFVGTGYVFVTTFENIRRYSDVWTSHKWSYVIMDEGHKIKSPDADVTLSCKRLRTPHRLLLSGTPIQNDLRELWSLLDFVFPGRLGTLPAFETEFADPIKKGGYANASPMQVQMAYARAIVLRDLINPYLLRRQKKDVKEISLLPGKTEQVLFCRLNKRQRLLYEAYIGSDEVARVIQGTSQSFRAITILRKICNHPELVEDETFGSIGGKGEDDIDSMDEEGSEDDDMTGEGLNESFIEQSGKLSVLGKILPLWHKQGHRVLIFSQWRKMLDIIQRFIVTNGWKFARMDGNTSVGSRQEMVDKFNEDKSFFVLLMTTRTGGVGLNLTGADRIILYDPDWNPQTDAQAKERAWRFGQKNAVTIYRLITAGTIEEKIYHRQIFKTTMTNQVLQDPRQRRLFSQKHLKDLFTLRADVESVAKGGDGCTETGEVMKGSGVITPESMDLNSSATTGCEKADDNDTLGTLLRSKGLAGVFDHNFADKPRKRKSGSILEMEEEAKKVARKALKALKDSLPAQRQFAPTPTTMNTFKSQPQRFGVARRTSPITQNQELKVSTKAHVKEGHSFEHSFGGSSSAGVAVSAEGAVKSSSTLLAQLQQRRQQAACSGMNSGADSENNTGDTSRYTKLMKRLRGFLDEQSRNSRSGDGPTTEHLLDEFSNVPNQDAAIFKQMLNSLAVPKNGRWRLKD